MTEYRGNIILFGLYYLLT